MKSPKKWQVMGILNVTPDSFSDGGVYSSTISSVVDYAAKMVEDGATILDIGGESTRPGSLPVSKDEELNRVVPVVEALSARFDVTLSIDTTKSIVAEESLKVGAHWINDVSSGRVDPKIINVVSLYNASVVLMHSRKSPKDMQEKPYYKDVVNEVISELNGSVKKFLDGGVHHSKIIIDPGFGFAKRFEDNLVLLQQCDKLLSLGFPLLIGTSRKSFIGTITGKDVSNRVAGSLATVGETYKKGATIFRVHDVEATVDYLKVLDAIHGINNEVK